MKLGAGVVSVLLALTLVLSAIPPVSAVSPTIVQKNSHGANASSDSVAFNSGVTSGNLLIIGILCHSLNTIMNASSMSDTKGNTWTAVNSTGIHAKPLGFVQANGGGNQFNLVNIFSATAKSSGADTISYKCQPSAVVDSVWAFIYEVTGQGPNVASGYGGANTGSTFTTNNSPSGISFPANTFLVAVVESAAVSNVSVAAGFTVASEHGFSTAAQSYFGTDAGVTSPSTFQSTDGSSTWALMAAAFSGPVQQVVATQVIACTAFQLQCWWYPMLFFGVYGGAFMMAGGAGKVSPKGLTFLMLSGLTFASLTMVLMDMINIMFPLMLTALSVLFVVRSR